MPSRPPLVKLTESRDDNHRKPSFSVNRPSENHGPRFAGLPMGHEFTSLILALLQIGGYPPKVEQAVLDQIRALDGDFEFEIYVSLTCHNCPDVVQALNLMAVQNPRIRTTMIEGGTFQEEVKERQIMAVPTVFLNGTEFGQGRMSLEEILAKIDTSGVEREAKKIAAKDPFDVLIVGGGPAGAAAAVYAARKGIRTGVASERFGGQVLDTMGIENFISIKETEGPKFAHALEEHVRDYDVDIMNLQRAKALVPGNDLIEVKLGKRRLAQEPLGHHLDRRALAQHQRARRARVQEQGRGLLPALRRPAVQGQARGGDRRRQLGRGGGDRPGRHRGPRRR